MSLRDEMALYTELTGEDGTKVPIGQLGHFLWGYEIGLTKGRPKGKWIDSKCSECNFEPIIEPIMIDLTSEPRLKSAFNFCPSCGADMRGGQVATCDRNKCYENEINGVPCEECECYSDTRGEQDE